ncbi:unnamed protein product [Coregonus sp. 'balchen']|nr:unnamed protein product [Coregonus sp. 'balchen']
MGMFTITVTPKLAKTPTGQGQTQSNYTTTPGPTQPQPTKVPNPVQVINVRDFTDSDQLGTETGYEGRENMWLAYMRYTARTLHRQDCVICGHARPELATHPFALGEGEGWQCILEEFYHSLPNTTLCKALSLIFPEVPPQKAPGGVKAYGGNYSCITGTGKGVNYGRLPLGDCAVNVTMNSTWPVEGRNQTKRVADVWWICGPNRRLTPILKGDWQGTCALASLIIPLTIIDVTSDQLLGSAQLTPEDEGLRQRRKRSAPWAAGVEIHPNLLGVPVGVPAEFQALNRNDGMEGERRRDRTHHSSSFRVQRGLTLGACLWFLQLGNDCGAALKAGR